MSLRMTTVVPDRSRQARSSNWVLLPLAVAGGIWLAARSRRRLIIVAVPIVVVAINAALFYGSTRLRVAAEPSIAVLASAGALWVLGGIRRKGGRDPSRHAAS